MERETTIQNIFSPADLEFRIPSYQRAYAWETGKQVCQFLDDLKEHPQTPGERKSYFLGHFLFERSEVQGNEFLVIDGQQRLTTVVIFFHCLGNELIARKQGGEQLRTSTGNEVNVQQLRQRYVIDETSRRKLRTVDYDDALFRSLILKGNSPTPPKTRSGARLKGAIEYMTKQIREEKSTAELIRWMELVETAVITTFEVRSKEQATQIFAFQNDRGKKLTDLEKLKAYLMHVVYVHSPRSIERESIEDVERKFAEIYGLAEEIKSLNEDQVLSHHLMAFVAGTTEPVDLLKKQLSKKPAGHERVGWIRDFCSELVQSFENVTKIESLKDGGAQHERLIGDVLHLNAPASWPLLLKLMHFHGHELARAEESLRLMEIILFKLQFMKRTWTNRLPNIAKDYEDGHIETLEGVLTPVSQHGFQGWWHFNGGVRVFLEGSAHYDHPTRYLLWKYENHLRASERGVHHLSLQEYLNETEGQNLDGSIEHIMPQHPETLVHSEEFKQQYLNNLGNLVLMTRGRNSSLKNKLPLEKAQSLELKTPYLSQQAVVKTILERGWGEAEITDRKQEIVKFAMQYWRVGS
jgi:Protein of unknown function DUF262/Protein of unknown function (DUF1524)